MSALLIIRKPTTETEHLLDLKHMLTYKEQFKKKTKPEQDKKLGDGHWGGCVAMVSAVKGVSLTSHRPVPLGPIIQYKLIKNKTESYFRGSSYALRELY